MLDYIDDFLARVNAVATSAVTYLVAAGGTVAALSTVIASYAPNGWQDDVTAVGTAITGVLASVVAVIRRVTPVEPEYRGLTWPGEYNA